MKRVFLIGYMGSGKTTLGKAYSAATGLQFIDLDWYIEERMHKSISDLFAERGEEGFRQLERKMLHEAGEFEDVLIAHRGLFDNASEAPENSMAAFRKAVDAGYDIHTSAGVLQEFYLRRYAEVMA